MLGPALILFHLWACADAVPDQATPAVSVASAPAPEPLPPPAPTPTCDERFAALTPLLEDARRCDYTASGGCGRQVPDLQSCCNVTADGEEQADAYLAAFEAARDAGCRYPVVCPVTCPGRASGKCAPFAAGGGRCEHP